MLYQQLGRTGLFVSRLAFGTSTFGGSQHPLYKVIGGLDQRAADRIVAVALDAGVNLFDTADIYAEGESEAMLAKALAGRRNDVLIATKAGNRSGAGPNDVGHSRVHLTAAIEASLRRLATGHVDLLQLHAFDPLAPFEETVRTLDDLVRSGKVRYVGVSNFSAWQVIKMQAAAVALGCERLVSVQAYYSVVGRDIEREIVPATISEGLGLLTWCPLAGGLLTGKYTRSRRPADASRRLHFDFPPVNMDRAYDVIDVLERIAAGRGATVAQVALAWQFRQPGVTSAIVGARDAAQLAENVKAVGLELSDEDLAQIDAVSRLAPEYPAWYHNLPLGRRPGEQRGIGRAAKK
jgi:aryl-alcohol dehydrogenase-like predicted oxidoreductase